jgi:hypothetical protein
MVSPHCGAGIEEQRRELMVAMLNCCRERSDSFDSRMD